MSYAEIHAWILLTGKFVTPEEIRWLIDMDNGWLTAIATEKADRREREKAEAERNKGRG